jgi:hypothetical protein
MVYDIRKVRKFNGDEPIEGLAMYKLMLVMYVHFNIPVGYWY